MYFVAHCEIVVIKSLSKVQYVTKAKEVIYPPCKAVLYTVLFFNLWI